MKGLVLLFVITFLFSCEKENTEKKLTTAKSQKQAVQKFKNFDISPWKKASVDWKQFEGITLSILADAQPAFRALGPFLPYFEQLTGMKVGYQNVEQMRMRKIIKLDLSSGSGIYDVIPVGVIFLGEAYQNKWLENLYPYLNDKVLTDSKWYDFEDISKKSLELCQKNGELLSIPFDFSAPIFFYRKDLFEKYNIPLPDTYQDVVNIKKKLQEELDKDGMKGVYAFATRARPGVGDNTWTVIPAIRAYGGDMLDKDFKPIFDSPSAIKALTIYRDMVTGYGNPPNAQTLHFYEIRKLFREGKLASTILASHFFNEIDSEEKSPIWDKWDATLNPKGDVSRETNPWAWSFAINSSSKNKKAAWLFIQWATSKETARLLKTGGAPARVSVWESDYYKSMNAPGLIGAVKWILKEGTVSSMELGIPEFTRVGEVTSIAFSEIFYGADVKKTLTEASLKVEKIMANGESRKGKK
ncbi:MAG: sugar ABC transporter substrate-binding protein [Leptospiraceae bacterium]|nr:sugar ABC transporter substrate-binding protein [Leptospiraceae bacterium]MCP5496506.1 sugar ABC transporter substrate-binding protein [Leptospiraceae bacterium]